MDIFKDKLIFLSLNRTYSYKHTNGTMNWTRKSNKIKINFYLCFNDFHICLSMHTKYNFTWNTNPVSWSLCCIEFYWISLVLTMMMMCEYINVLSKFVIYRVGRFWYKNPLLTSPIASGILFVCFFCLLLSLLYNMCT